MIEVAAPGTGQRAGASRVDRALLALLGYGLALSTATQLRVPGAPLGPGEMLLAVWVAGAWTVLALKRRSTPSPYAYPFVAFWAVSLSLLTFGLLVAALRGEARSDSYHDLSAFLFVSVVVATFAITGANGADLDRLVSRVLVVSVSLMGLLLAGGLAVPGALAGLGVQVWYGPRFTAWALNPNQISLLMCGAPFLLLELRSRSAERGRRRLLAFLAGVSVLAGLATLSDGLVLAWAMGAGLMVVSAYRFRVFLRGTGRVGAFVAYILVPASLLAGVTAFPVILAGLEGGLAGIYENGGQGSQRIDLWTHGLQAAQTAPILGLGPGAFSGEDRPFQDFEAHNTLIDWGASTGLLGVTLYVVLLLWVVRGVWRSGRVPLIAVVPSLVAFGMVHYTLRQPIFWFYLIFAAALSRAEVPGPVPAGESSPA